MFTSENDNLIDNCGESKKINPAKKGLIIYLCVSAFCFVFYLVYNSFSHGVHSVFMTYLFAVPLVLGALPCLIFTLVRKIRFPNRLCVNLWNSGVAAVACASLLQGILEIAGAESVYHVYLFFVGVGFIFLGIRAFVFDKIRFHRNKSKN